MAGIKDTKIIKGQPHLLTYITPNEVEKLKALGGQETMTNEGIPAYPEWDSMYGAESKKSFDAGQAPKGNWSPSGDGGKGSTTQVIPKPVIPKKKPIPTKDNTVNEGFIKNYFNNNPYLNIANKLSQSKWSINQNAKARTRWLEKLKKEDPEQYKQIVGDLKKVNYVEEGVEFYGPHTKNIETFTDLGEDQAKEILGINYQNYLDNRNKTTGGEGNPYILPQYAMMGGGADLGGDDAVEDVTHDWHLGKGGQEVGRDVTLGYAANGGRISRADGGIMGTRARKAFGGIMDRVTGRKAYGLGSIFKSVKNAVSKVLKSDIGKAAIIGAGIYYGGGGNLFGMQRANAAGFGIPVKGKSFFGQGIAKALRSGVGSMFDPLNDKPSFMDKALKFAKWGALGYGLSKTPLGKPKPNETSFADRGGHLIDPISGKPNNMAGMRENIELAKLEAAGDPIKLAAIDAKYNNMLNLGQHYPYETYGVKDGGRIGKAEGGLMDLGGMEKDYRAEGGFVPIGAKEKADDVPARLSVNEFVFTADAVRNAGGGDIDQGAEVMENVMKNLEAGGKISAETQGNTGAQEMFSVSERLGEVI